MHITRYDLAYKTRGSIHDDVKFFIGHFIPTTQRNFEASSIIDKMALTAQHINEA
jgi:hypothetical protein